MTQIIPAILATTEEEYRDKLQAVVNSDLLQNYWVQIDFMDNKFVQNKSIGLDIIGKYKANLKLEAHLMVDYPENWIDDLIKLQFSRIIFPIEDFSGIEERIDHIKNHGIEVGIALNPETPVERITPFVSKIDVVLILSVHPGFGGQEFITNSFDKIKEAVKLRNTSNTTFLIEVDGGVNEHTAKKIIEAGADNLVIGSHLFEGNINENIEKIRQTISS